MHPLTSINPKPRDVFDEPHAYWPFLTASSDDQFENQYFDRKEAGRAGYSANVREIIKDVRECVSAFANANINGGLLVLGIASDGSVKGVNHLLENQRNSITNIGTFLINHAVEVKFHDCMDETGAPNQVLLIYTHYVDRAICETLGNTPEAWCRSGPQNVILNQHSRDRIRRRKQIVDFENSFSCEFNLADVDQGILEAFKREYVPDGARRFLDEELLYEAGAIVKAEHGYRFTNAGLLFFAANPQRIMSSAAVRLIRYNTTSENSRQRGTPTFDKLFTGPITKQIRDTRTFFRESGFFKNLPDEKTGRRFRGRAGIPVNCY